MQSARGRGRSSWASISKFTTGWILRPTRSSNRGLKHRIYKPTVSFQRITQLGWCVYEDDGKDGNSQCVLCVIARWAEPTVATSPRPGLVLSRLLGRSPLPRGESKCRAPRVEDGVSLQYEDEHAHTHKLVVDKSIG